MNLLRASEKYQNRNSVPIRTIPVDVSLFALKQDASLLALNTTICKSRKAKVCKKTGQSGHGEKACCTVVA